MTPSASRRDEWIGELPLPLAQLYRRALNAKTALDRHHNAYYLAEATLKLAACLRIGIGLSHGIEPGSPLAQSLEALCLPSIGHWVGFLRETSEYLRRRPDAALLPLADASDKLSQNQALPPVRAFAERISRAAGEEQPPLTPEQVRDPLRQGALGFFTIVAAYRNQVFGHGAQRPTGYYEEVGPLLLDAVLAVLRLPFLFGGLQLAVARLELGPSGQETTIAWQGLTGPASLALPADAAGSEPTGNRTVPGQLYFVARGVRVPLAPLAVYQEDRSGRERVGFLNRAVVRKSGEEEVRRCEYLDYATGDPLREIDARAELTRLLARLRGRDVAAGEVDRIIAVSTAEPGETDDAPALTAGAVIGDFELEGELGRGGMGVVYKARQRSLNRRVALKVLPPALAADPTALARFRRETAALARCDHSSLVKILTSGSDGDRHYYAMELVEGTDLADLFAVLSAWGQRSRQTLRVGHLPTAISSSCELARRRRQGESAPAADDPSAGLPSLAPVLPPPPPAEGPALSGRLGELLGDAADALAHLHERGVLHRDIKPGNLMLTADGRRLVLMDLGLARLEDEAPDRLTRTRQFLGTLQYASPEQVLSATAVDARSDVYSLGATLWEMLALRPLYGAGPGVSDTELVRRIQFDDPGRIRKYRPEVPAELEAIVLQCLEKNPRRRYASARELADDLGRWRRGEAVLARRLTTTYRLRKFAARRRRPLLIGTAVLLGLTAIYLLLADADFRVPGGEAVRRRLDEHEVSLFRPIPEETAIRRQAADMRVTQRDTLLNACPERPGWWDASLRPGPGDVHYDAWTQGQTTTALLTCPETDAGTRRALANSVLQLFEGWTKRLDPFVEGSGFQLFRISTKARPYPSGIGTAWALPALALALEPSNALEPARRRQLEERLSQLQKALDNYQAVDSESKRHVGAWKLYVEQKDPSRVSPYVTATVFMGLLDLRRSGLSWRGDPDRPQALLHDTENWVIEQFDGRGWQCPGPSGSQEHNDGLTLWLFALLLRAETEDGLVLPENIVQQIPRHLADCGKRPADYPISVSMVNHPFRYLGQDYDEEARVIRVLWYPWAVETASRWLERCHRIGAPRSEVVRARRVLGHLVLTLGPQFRSELTTGQTFIPTETLLGLSAVPLPD
jgi:serine/threonine protein kinase